VSTTVKRAVLFWTVFRDFIHKNANSAVIVLMIFVIPFKSLFLFWAAYRTDEGLFAQKNFFKEEICFKNSRGTVRVFEFLSSKLVNYITGLIKATTQSTKSVSLHYKNPSFSSFFKTPAYEI
jgi:hypothetical protein